MPRPSAMPESLVATVVIAGFGAAGASVALALVSGGMAPQDILVVDPEIDREASASPDMRILAFNAGSRHYLSALGIWPELTATAWPMRRIRLTDTTLEQRFRNGLFGFDAPEDGEALAHLVPLGLVQAHLRTACRAAGVPLRQGRLSAITNSVDRVEAVLDGARVSARLLIAADGAQSPIRRDLGIPVHGWAYGQNAIVATIRHSGPHGGEAVQHFLPSGPFAMLPLDEGRSSIVWSEVAAQARAILAADPETQRLEIERRAAGWRGDVLGVEGISTHPLRLGLARRYFAGRTALLADAAHVVHPLAGQGLNLGFEDAATLAELVIDHLRLGLDPGAPDLLEAYQARRRPAAAAMAFATDGVNRLFSNDLPPLRAIRGLGARLIDRMPRLKAEAMRLAAGGGHGEAPRLFRGQAL